MFGRESADLAKKYFESLRKRAIDKRFVYAGGGTDATEHPQSRGSRLRGDGGRLEDATASAGNRNRCRGSSDGDYEDEYDGHAPASQGDSPQRGGGFQFAVDVSQRHQACIPPVGSLHACCASSCMFALAASEALFGSLVADSLESARLKVDAEHKNLADDSGASEGQYQLASAARTDSVLACLRDAANGLAFAKYDGTDAAAHERVYDGVMSGYSEMIGSEEFTQLGDFVFRFASLLKSSFKGAQRPERMSYASQGMAKRRRLKRCGKKREGYRNREGRLELFQKMILMHATYFAACITLDDESTERMDQYLAAVFNTPLFSPPVLQHFKQRTCVFLVPRRHGKTWFLVPLISLLVSCFEGIRIGYTAHLRKATKPVFEEIYARLCRWYGEERVHRIKGETISFAFRNGARSSIIFASSQNTNVSIRQAHSSKHLYYKRIHHTHAYIHNLRGRVGEKKYTYARLHCAVRTACMHAIVY